MTRVDVTNPLDTVVIHVSADASHPRRGPRPRRGLDPRHGRRDRQASKATARAGSAAVTLIPGDSARLPTAPSSPNVRLNLALGALVGLALGIGYAVLRHVLDRRVRDPRDIERETGVSVVGTLPLDKQLSSDARSSSTSTAPARRTRPPVAEALRELRTNLQFMDVDNPPRTIVVTSPLPGDGKSTLAGQPRA